jgi:hypothetical protein
MQGILSLKDEGLVIIVGYEKWKFLVLLRIFKEYERSYAPAHEQNTQTVWKSRCLKQGEDKMVDKPNREINKTYTYILRRVGKIKYAWTSRTTKKKYNGGKS